MFKAGFKAGHGAGSNGEFDNESGTVASTEPNTGPNTVRWTAAALLATAGALVLALSIGGGAPEPSPPGIPDPGPLTGWGLPSAAPRSEEHTSEPQSRGHLVCRLLLEKKKPRQYTASA